jgi:hypothetical protein
LERQDRPPGTAVAEGHDLGTAEDAATNRIQFVLSGMQNRKSGSYLAAINRILVLLVSRGQPTMVKLNPIP